MQKGTAKDAIKFSMSQDVGCIICLAQSEKAKADELCFFVLVINDTDHISVIVLRAAQYKICLVIIDTENKPW
jgi:hypothetical protein